jgi:hypothetical protein
LDPAYVFFGTYLLMHPVLGVASLTLVVALLFLVEGILDIVLFFHVRSERGPAWVLLDTITTLVLALLIYLQWPSSSVGSPNLLQFDFPGTKAILDSGYQVFRFSAAATGPSLHPPRIIKV